MKHKYFTTSESRRLPKYTENQEEMKRFILIIKKYAIKARLENNINEYKKP